MIELGYYQFVILNKILNVANNCQGLLKPLSGNLKGGLVMVESELKQPNLLIVTLLQ